MQLPNLLGHKACNAKVDLECPNLLPVTTGIADVSSDTSTFRNFAKS